MFTWWISWVWVLWASWAYVGADAMWAAGIVQQEAAAAGGAAEAAAAAAAGGATATGTAKKEVRLGPGMGGSAVQSLGREGVQHFATQPTPQTAVVGSTAVLPCRVINKVGHLQWTKDGFGLGTERDLFGFSRYAMIGSDDEGDFSLRIQPVLLEDDALYQCQVSASDGVPGIRSHTARLTVYVPPEPPRVKPAILRTTAGMTVTLECESRGGRPPPEIQWVDDSRRETIRTGSILATEAMPDGKRVTVRSRLSFTPRRSHHNSSVTCLTSNQALSSPLTSSMQLSVLFSPEVRLHVRPQQLIEGDDATFICSAQANPSVITYRWYHNSQELQNQTSRTLTLYKISRKLHEDAISCEVSNKVGTSKKTQTVHVQYGPMFRSLPRDVMAETGKEVLLKCDVDANPPSTIVWLQEGSDKVIGSGRELVVVVGASTAGVYTCVASVRGFPDLQGRLRVLVKGPPTIVSAGEQQGRMGDTVTLECSTVSIPSPIRITWTYNGREIDFSDPRYDVVQDEQEEGLRNILVIHDADSQDFGAYNCSVVNEYGVARKQIRLNKEKTVPVLLLVGGVVALVVVAVVVASLVLCNKRHTTIKGSPVPEKPVALTVVPGPQVANMYSAASDTKLSEDLTPATTPSHPTFEQLTPTDQAKVRVAHALNRLSGDSGQTFIPDPDSEGGRGYVPFVDYSGRDYAPVPNGRRASFSDLGPYTHPGPPTSISSATTDFCTIRRGTRGSDLAAENGRSLLASPNYHDTSSLRHNGNAHTLSRHSAYSTGRATTYGSPPPPPYPKNPKIGSPRGAPSPTGPQALTLPNSIVHTDEHGSPEAKYIFSPEAMMKPGTLV
ncbi:irregular chiasm C-roughest protein isoform X3 [Procambarus clarkii]|uniref:irregular chiasm C-roughest protein isoform X3 n=1 Tax=Procambarus clarkii TaxID=6728 RepID=UPI0037438A49